MFEYFDSPSEDIRSGAALAAGQSAILETLGIADCDGIGNLAVGSPKVQLPVIVKKIEASSTPASRLLSLLALKEVNPTSCCKRSLCADYVVGRSAFAQQPA